MRWMVVAASCLGAALLLGVIWLGYLGGDPFTILRPADYRARPGAPMAIILSGDMGFRIGMATFVARRFEQAGVPVVGINSLSYFRTTRTASDTATLIEEAIQRAKVINPAGRIILIGQSYGADMLQVGLTKLPARERSGIALVALVVPGATVAFRASPAELLTFAMPQKDAMPTARQLDWVPLLCIYGIEEKTSLCPLLHQRNLLAVALPGGHPLRWDTDGVYRTIRKAMVRAGFPLPAGRMYLQKVGLRRSKNG